MSPQAFQQLLRDVLYLLDVWSFWGTFVDNTDSSDDFHINFFSLEEEINSKKNVGVVWEPVLQEKWKNCLLEEELSFEKSEFILKNEGKSVDLDPFFLKKINELISLI